MSLKPLALVHFLYFLACLIVSKKERKKPRKAAVLVLLRRNESPRPLNFILLRTACTTASRYIYSSGSDVAIITAVLLLCTTKPILCNTISLFVLPVVVCISAAGDNDKPRSF